MRAVHTTVLQMGALNKSRTCSTFCFSFQCVAKPYAASPHAVVHDVCDILIKLKIKRKKVNNVIASYKTNLYCSLYSAPQHPQCNMAAGVNKPLVRKKIVSVGLREGS